MNALYLVGWVTYLPALVDVASVLIYETMLRK